MIMITLIPACSHSRTAAFASRLGGSIMPTSPTNVMPLSASSGVAFLLDATARTLNASAAISRATSRTLARSAFDNATIGMGVVALDGRWLQVNRSLCEIIGYGESELLASEVRAVTHREDLVALEEQMQRFVAGSISSHQAELRYCHKSGKEVWAHLGMSLVRDGEARPLHLIFQIQDITDRKLAEQQLHHDAFHDALTGLPNRALFMDHLKLAIARARRNAQTKFAVLYLDLDRFKVINDSLGHTIGDQLLVGIADRLKKNLRPGDTVARLGGDEFTILLDDLADDSEAGTVAERIQQDRLARTRLAGNGVQAGGELEGGLLDQGHVFYGDLREHYKKVLRTARHQVQSSVLPILTLSRPRPTESCSPTGTSSGSPPSKESSASRSFTRSSTTWSAPRTNGRLTRECGAIGTMTKQATSPEIKGPPAESA